MSFSVGDKVIICGGPKWAESKRRMQLTEEQEVLTLVKEAEHAGEA